MGNVNQPFDETVSKISERVKLSLQSDLVSYGELRQIANDAFASPVAPDAYVQAVIARLLAEGVEVGNAVNVSGTYVKFVAWRGTIDERIRRAFRLLGAAQKRDRDYSFWLCLAKNVDEFESEPLNQ